MNDLKSDVMIELHVPDFGVAKDFYGSLGYEVVWEKQPQGPDGYMVMRSGASILNFYCGSDDVYDHSYFKKFPKDTPRGYGVEIIIPITDIKSFYTKYTSVFPDSVVSGLSSKHSHQDFRAIDPFGFYIRFVERYNWVEGRDSSGNKLEQ
jgi:hypothetical protein